jgi:pyruvate kinase
MSSVQTPQALFEAMKRLRADVLANSEQLVSTWHLTGTRESFLDSARNLASYLAMRRYDLRELQLELIQWGLSSLGRSESRVQPTLDAVVATLGAICDADASELPAYPDEQTVFQGYYILTREVELLFGRAQESRTTRIMVTMPTEAAQDLDWMKSLLQAGMQCVRINCAHDDAETWEAMIDTLRCAEQELGLTERARVLMDLGGPKVRTVRPKKSEKDRYHIGDKLLLVYASKLSGIKSSGKKSPGKKKGKQKTNKTDLPVVGCTLGEALDQLVVGQRVYIDDGQIGARVVDRVAEGAVLEIFQASPKGRRIRSDKGLNFPDTKFEVVPLTDKDRKDLDFVVLHADMVGYSFVQAGSDIHLLLHELEQRLPSGRQMPALVLKIETKRAVQNLPDLLVQAASHLPTAVMIARGDLAIELGFERMAEMQEEILWLCEAAHIPVIWATQVLEGLAKEGLPTRGEVTDAAMANRAECVMLNKGPYIVNAVHMLDDVLTRMESHQYKKTPLLRSLRSWQALFTDELVVAK